MSDMLLQHPKPFKNDSLADYLFHLSQKNYCDFMWILAPYETSREKIYEKLNTCANEVLLLHISELTGVSEDEIRDLTLNRFGYNSSEFFQDNVFLKESSKFCPLCLKENNYQRIFWQIKFINICMDHNTFLLNRCSCGRNITLENVILGVCTCGKKLSDIEPEFNKYSVTLYTQIGIYKAFNITNVLQSVECPNVNVPSIDFSNEKLLALADMVEQISEVTSHMVKDTLYNFSKYPNLFFLKLNSTYILTYVLRNWPKNFYKYLNVVNFNTNNQNTDHNYFRLPYYNPIISIYSIINYKREHFKYLGKELIDYFIKNYNTFFIELCKETYVLGSKIAKLFSITTYNVQKLFVTKSTEGSFYVNLYDVLNFFNQYIAKSKLVNTKDNNINIRNYVSLNDLDKYFMPFDCSINEISDVLLKSNIDIKIDIFSNGLDMILFPSDESKKLLLEFSLRKYTTHH